MDAFLAFMPSGGIWDIEGRVRGFDLGNGRFHFNFETEEDLQKVLRKRPCHFNKWTFSLERWELDFQENLLCKVNFLVRIRDLPLRCWVEEAFRGIGSALGQVVEVDVTEARVLVSMNERDCPLLTENQRLANKERRAAALPVETRRNEEGQITTGGRRGTDQRNETRSRAPRDGEDASIDRENQSSHRPEKATHRHVRRNLYTTNDIPRTEVNRTSVWQRVGSERPKSSPRHRETSIQSSSGSRKKREEASGDSLRTHSSRRNLENLYVPLRRRESPLRIRSPPRDERRSSRRPPRHQSNLLSVDQVSKSSKDKGKGKMVETDYEVAEDDEDLVQEKDSAAPKNFEVGSSSGETRVGVVLDLPITQAPPVGIQQTLATDNLPVIEQGEQALDGMGVDDGLSDWADEENYWEEENQEERVADEANDNQAFDSVPSDWENLANEEVEEEVASDKEITEEDMRLMKELENEMILDGLLEGDDLLGEELMDVDQDDFLANSEASPERTISEQVIPVSHPVPNEQALSVAEQGESLPIRKNQWCPCEREESIKAKWACHRAQED
ncbi:unnamed protein product [Arabidopsis halleri]